MVLGQVGAVVEISNYLLAPVNPEDRLENPVDPVVSQRDDPVGVVVWVAYNVTPKDLQDPEEVEFLPGEVR